MSEGRSLGALPEGFSRPSRHSPQNINSPFPLSEERAVGKGAGGIGIPKPGYNISMTNDHRPFLGLDPAHYGLTPALSNDIRLLDNLLGDVLREQEGDDLVDLARQLLAASEAEDADPTTLFERLPELSDPERAQRLLRAFTVLFQLLNTAEQKEIVRVNRERQARAGGKPRTESIRDAIFKLRDDGVPAESLQTLLNQMDICPTLTAHPTEARRRAVLDKLNRIAAGLAQRGRAGNPDAARLDEPLSSEGTPRRVCGGR